MAQRWNKSPRDRDGQETKEPAERQTAGIRLRALAVSLASAIPPNGSPDDVKALAADENLPIVIRVGLGHYDSSFPQCVDTRVELRYRYIEHVCYLFLSKPFGWCHGHVPLSFFDLMSWSWSGFCVSARGDGTEEPFCREL